MAALEEMESSMDYVDRYPLWGEENIKELASDLLDAHQNQEFYEQEIWSIRTEEERVRELLEEYLVEEVSDFRKEKRYFPDFLNEIADIFLGNGYEDRLEAERIMADIELEQNEDFDEYYKIRFDPF